MTQCSVARWLSELPAESGLLRPLLAVTCFKTSSSAWAFKAVGTAHIQPTFKTLFGNMCINPIAVLQWGILREFYLWVVTGCNNKQSSCSVARQLFFSCVFCLPCSRSVINLEFEPKTATAEAEKEAEHYHKGGCI